MGDVVGIFGERPSQLGEPRDDLIGVLENLLDRARSGELQSVVATGLTSEGLRMSAFGGTYREDVYSMLGGVVWLQHEYVHKITGE
jgi:hypothetical protein